MAKIKDFVVGTTYVPFDEVNSDLIVRKIEKLKMKPGTGEWDKKFYFANNAGTNGICHPVYQELFKSAKRQYIASANDIFEVVPIGIPKSAKGQIGVGENLRCTFNWAGMKFDGASIVIIPGENYILPREAAVTIRRFLESKNLTPDTLGVSDDHDGTYFLTNKETGIPVELSDYDISELDY